MTRRNRLTRVALTLSLLVASRPVGADEIQVEELARATASWDGSDLPDYRPGEAQVTILRITIPPKTRLPLHKHPVINAGLVLRGTLTVVAEKGDVLQLAAGDSIVELVDQWHYGRNDGTEPVEIVVFYAGVEGQPITIAK